VHPRNIIVSPNESIYVIDFGLASWPAVLPDLPEPPGDAHPHYVSPESARAMLAGRPSLAASMRSEQHALGVLCYFIFTGRHYLSFKLERTEWLRQVSEERQLPFSACGQEPWPQVEAVLAKALAKDPMNRFPSVTEFSIAFDAAVTTKRTSFVQIRISFPSLVTSQSGAGCLLENVVQRLGRPPDELPLTSRLAPTCSVNYGASGIAYFFYRLACLRSSSEYLATANVWSRWSQRHIADSDASHCDEIRITKEVTGPTSLYHTASGVHYVQVLINLAFGDFSSANQAVKAFVEACKKPCDNLDLAVGRSGVLLACANLLNALPLSQNSSRASLQELGEETALSLLDEVDNSPKIQECQRITSLGIAHGWAGILYAMLRWFQTTKSQPVGIQPKLDELAGCAQISEDGASWPLNMGKSLENRSRWASWCNGSAGYVYLWTLAYQMYGEEHYRHLAEHSGSYVWNVACRRTNAVANLCCGYAGEAYALLKWYRSSGSEVWLDRARSLCDRATLTPTMLRKDSLFKGDVGIALLAEEVLHPRFARMPVFEDEGWENI